MRSNDDLIDDVERRAAAYLGNEARSPAVLGAMRRVDRRLFLPAIPVIEAYEDCALPIGRGQTCSEPSMVAFMMDLLEIRSGQRVLEIGAGSGYAAAVAALLCGSGGVVYACEAIRSLAQSMAAHLDRWIAEIRGNGRPSPAAEINIIVADGSAGFPSLAPFDRILISAGVQRRGVVSRGVVAQGGAAPAKGGFLEVPLLNQLMEDGILLYPEAYGDLHRTRKNGTVLTRDVWSGVAFVPLRGRNA